MKIEEHHLDLFNIKMKFDRETWLKEYWKTLKRQHSLDKFWTLKLNKAKKTCGMCDYDTKTIFISKKYLLSDKVNISHIKNTILHEIAHALVGPDHAHNDTWKKKALEIGCDGKIYNELKNFVPYTYKLSCHCGCVNDLRYKKSNVSNRICGICKSNLHFIKI